MASGSTAKACELTRREGSKTASSPTISLNAYQQSHLLRAQGLLPSMLISSSWGTGPVPKITWSYDWDQWHPDTSNCCRWKSCVEYLLTLVSRLSRGAWRRRAPSALSDQYESPNLTLGRYSIYSYLTAAKNRKNGTGTAVSNRAWTAIHSIAHTRHLLVTGDDTCAFHHSPTTLLQDFASAVDRAPHSHGDSEWSTQ